MGRKQNESAETVWRDRLIRFDRSDYTVRAFCQNEGVSEAAFYHWRKRLKIRRRCGQATHPPDRAPVNDIGSFVPVNVRDAAFAEVEFRNGVRVRVPATNTEALRAVLTAGEAMCREVG